MEKKRVLIFIDWFLPGFKAGGPVRSIANMVEHLHEDVQFFIITRNTEYLETTPYLNLVYDKWIDFITDVKVFYCSKECISLKKWTSLINEVKPNTIYINGIYSLNFSLISLIAAKKFKISRIIIAPRGMLANSAIDVKSLKKRVFLFFAKKTGFFNNVMWHVTNDKEGNEVRYWLCKKGVVFIIPNLPKVGYLKSQLISKKSGQLCLCSLARISPEKNTLFALNSLLKINQEKDIVFDIYGQIYNKQYWHECEKVISKLSSMIKVNYMGVVSPDKVSETLSKYHALFLPSRGENFGNIILESFMTSRPVIISDQTPWHSLMKQNAGWDLPLSDMYAFTRIIEKFADMGQSDFNMLCNGAGAIANDVLNDKTTLKQYREMLIT